VIEADGRPPIVGEPVVEGKIVGDDQMRVGGQFCDSGVRESELDKVWRVGNLLGGPIPLVEFRNNANC
jgi:hypothetical protein